MSAACSGAYNFLSSLVKYKYVLAIKKHLLFHIFAAPGKTRLDPHLELMEHRNEVDRSWLSCLFWRYIKPDTRGIGYEESAAYIATSALG